MKQLKQITFIAAIFILTDAVSSLNAQTTSVLTAGLDRPIKIIEPAYESSYFVRFIDL